MISKFLGSGAFVILLLAAVVVVSVFALNYAFIPTMDDIEWREEAYIVQAGDSLWAISGWYCPGSVDRREWIDEVQALNGLEDSVLHPGQKLTVLSPVGEG